MRQVLALGACLLGCASSSVFRPATVFNDVDFVYAADLSPDGERLALSRLGPTHFQLDLFAVHPSGKRIISQALSRVEHDVEGLAFSPDGRWLVTGGRDGALRVFEARSGKEIGVETFPEPVSAVAFDAESRLLAVGSASGILGLFSVGAWKALQQSRGHSGEVRALAFSPAGSLLSGGWDKRVVAWKCPSLEVDREYVFDEYVNDFSLSADGRMLGLALSDQKAERTPALYQKEKREEWDAPSTRNAGVLLDLETGREWARWASHRGIVSTAAISPDGQRLVTGGWDHALYLHRLNEPSGKRVHTLGWIVRKARFSRAGEHLVVAGWTKVNPWGSQRSDPSALLFRIPRSP